MGCIRSATVREGDRDDPVRLAVIVTGSIIADRGNTDVRSKKASFLMPETENNVHSLSLRGQNKAIASCMYSHWSEASPQWSS